MLSWHFTLECLWHCDEELQLKRNCEHQLKENEQNSVKIFLNLRDVQLKRIWRNLECGRSGWNLKALGNLIKDCGEKIDSKEKQLRESEKEVAFELESSIQKRIDTCTKRIEDNYRSLWKVKLTLK